MRRQKEVSAALSKEEQVAGFRGWNERGYVPHRDEPGLTQFVTFRLADGFPEAMQAEWEMLLRIEDDRERRVQLEAWLDQGHGKCHLRKHEIAEEVAKALRKSDGERYRLKAYSIMPNHVHVLFEVGTVPVAKVVQVGERGVCACGELATGGERTVLAAGLLGYLHAGWGARRSHGALYSEQPSEGGVGE